MTRIALILTTVVLVLTIGAFVESSRTSAEASTRDPVARASVHGNAGVKLIGQGFSQIVSSPYGDRFTVLVLQEIAEGRQRIDVAITNSNYWEIDNSVNIVFAVTDQSGTLVGQSQIRAASADNAVEQKAVVVSIDGLPRTGDLVLAVSVPGYTTPVTIPIRRVKGRSVFEWAWSTDGPYAWGFYLRPKTGYIALSEERGLDDKPWLKAVSCQNLMVGAGSITVRSSGSLGTRQTRIRFRDICDVMPGWVNLRKRNTAYLGGSARVVQAKWLKFDTNVWRLNRTAKQTFRLDARLGSASTRIAFVDKATSSGGGGSGSGSGSGGGSGSAGGSNSSMPIKPPIAIGA